MGQAQSSNDQLDAKNIALKIPFEQGLMHIETEKHIYYPGDTINGNVHLLITEVIEEAKCLDIKVVGKESFNF